MTKITPFTTDELEGYEKRNHDKSVRRLIATLRLAWQATQDAEDALRWERCQQVADLIDRGIPNDPDSERATIGCVLVAPERCLLAKGLPDELFFD